MIFFFTMFEIGTSEIWETMPKHFSLPVWVLASVSIQINESGKKKGGKNEEHKRKMSYFYMWVLLFVVPIM